MSASEGARFEAEAAKVLAAAERALVRAQQLEGAIKRGETTAAEVESRVQRAVARDRVAGETVGQRPAKPGEIAAQDEAAVRKATTADTDRTRALEQETRAQAAVNRERATGTSINRLAFQKQYGPYAETRNLQQQAGLLRDINTLRQRAFYGGGLPGNRAPYLSVTPTGADDAARYYGTPGGPTLPGGGRGVVPPPGGFTALPAGRQAPTVVRSGFEAEAEAVTRAKAEVAGYRAEMSRLIQTQGTASQAMRRHGALTTEFIQAASRGEVTIRELGFQTAATVGKFGGWLGAGTAIYGVLGAVSALGTGALDAYSGVNQLSRVVTTGIDAPALRKSFRDLAGEFNLPIATVTDSVYQMGKVFHNTDDALQSARAVLYSVKVGELDVADATRYLIAIVNGFQLPASAMASVFDQINQAQNRFGITIEDVEAGLAKAGGQFRQSGGDFSHLLAIITTAQKVTGNTGQVIGTAIARAPNFLRQASNQQQLREFGIDASTNVEKVITQAFRISNKLSGARLQQLSAAIFGPQYGARVGTALLANRDLYEQVLKETSPKASKGSAENELQRALGSINEQIDKIIINFQRIGSALADAGAFDSLFILVKLLNSSLGAAETILETFNQLPTPLRHGLSLLLQMALAIRLLQRFQLGESIAGGQTAQPGGVRGGLAQVFGEGERGVARKYRAGLFTEQQYYEEQRAQLTSGAARAALQADAAGKQYLDATKRSELLARQGAQSTQQYAQAQITAQAAEEEMVAAKRQVLNLAAQQQVAEERLVQVNQSLAQTRKRFGIPGLNVRGAIDEARRTGASQFFPTLFQKPTTVAPSTIADAENRAVAEESRQLQLFGSSADKARATTERASATAARTEAAVARTANSTGRFSTGLGRVGGVLNRLLGSFGNLLFAGFAVSFVLDELNQITDSVQGEIDKAAISADSAKQQREQIATVRSQATSGTTFSEGVEDFFTGSGSFHGPIEDLLGIGGDQGAGDIRRSIAEQELAQQRLIDAMQVKARRQGEPVPYRYVSDIEGDIKDLQSRDISRRRARDLLDKYDKELVDSQEAFGRAAGTGKEQQQRIREAESQIKQAQADNASNKDLADRVATLQSDQLTEGLDAQLTLAGAAKGQAQKNAFERARVYYERIVVNLGQSRNAEDIKTLDQARQSFYDGIQQTVQDELQSGLTLARSPAERAQAYTQALNSLREQLQVAPRQDIRQQEQVVQRLKDQYAQQNRTRVRSLSNVPGLGGVADLLGVGDFKLPFKGATPRELDQLRNRIKGETEQAKSLREYLKQTEREYREIKAEIQQQRYEEQAAVRQSRTDLRVARTLDPLKQAQLQIDFLGREIERAIEQYGKGSQEVLDLMSQRQQAIQQKIQEEASIRQARADLQQALTGDPLKQASLQIDFLGREIQIAIGQYGAGSQQVLQLMQQREEAINQQLQSQLSLIEARGALRESNINQTTNPAAYARQQLSDLKAQLAFMQANAARFDPAQIIQLQAQINQAEQQLATTIRDQAIALRNAQFAVQSARAEASGNDVRVARVALRQAQYAYRHAQTRADRLNALAQVIQARAGRRDAIYNSEIEDIQFQADIGKLTLDQQIRQYQHLLHTLNLTRDLRRDLRRKIADLKNQQESEAEGFELKVGDIKLPTIYEIRRALQGGIDGRGHSVNVNQENHVTLAIANAQDAATVASQLDKVINGGAANALRSAGLA